jgi:hypothetical protein
MRKQCHGSGQWDMTYIAIIQLSASVLIGAVDIMILST